jgi:hypothetical protein
MNRKDIFEQIEERSATRTAQLIGRDDAAHLRWLIRFAEADGGRSAGPASKFDKVAASIQAFAERGGAVARNVGEDLTVQAAAQLSQTVREGLRAYVAGKTPDFPSLDFVHLQFSLVPGSSRSPWMGPWLPLFLIALADVVRSQHHRLRTCARSICGRLFFKRKRALYCSVACSRKERISKFRADRNRYSERRHDYYLRRLARTKGVSVESMRKKVRRRPRKS